MQYRFIDSLQIGHKELLASSGYVFSIRDVNVHYLIHLHYKDMQKNNWYWSEPDIGNNVIYIYKMRSH